MLVESQDTSMMPLAVPICAVIGGFVSLLATGLMQRSPSAARCLFRLAVLVFLFLLVACIMDTVAYFAVYSHLNSWDPRAPVVAAAASLNMLSAGFSMVVMVWMCFNLESQKSSGPHLDSPSVSASALV